MTCRSRTLYASLRGRPPGWALNFVKSKNRFGWLNPGLYYSHLPTGVYKVGAQQALLNGDVYGTGKRIGFTTKYQATKALDFSTLITRKLDSDPGFRWRAQIVALSGRATAETATARAYFKVTAIWRVRVGWDGFDGVANTVTVVVVELGCVVVADGAEEDCIEPPPPHALNPAARTMTAVAAKYLRRLGATNPAAIESNSSMLMMPNGVSEANDAACAVVRTDNVVEIGVPPLAFRVAGEKEHCAVVGRPVQENATEPAKPLSGVSLRSAEAGCPD